MANKYKKNKVYYYQLKPIYTNKSDKELETIKRGFKTAFKFSKEGLDPIAQGDGSVSALAGKVMNKRYIGGALIYTMETNIPPKWDAVGKRPASVDLEGFSGLGYDAAYFYDSDNMILAIESRVPGPTLSSLRSLILRNYELPGFEYLPVSSEKTYEKLLNTPGIKSMSMSMVNIDHGSNKSKKTPGISETKDLVDEANGERIEINISSGRGKERFLDKGYIKKMVDYAIKSLGGVDEVSKFEIKIVDLDSGKIDPIDLISGRISDETEIEKVRAINKFSIQEKIKQIEGNYLKRRPYLDDAYQL